MASKAEIEFINEYARTLLVEWAANTVRGIEPAIPFPLYGGGSGGGSSAEHMAKLRDEQLSDPFIAHALKKGWVSKDGGRVLAKGFTVAKGFLKR